MEKSIFSPIVLAVLVVLAGCSGIGTAPGSVTESRTATESQTETATASETPTPAPPVPLSKAESRALSAEENRVGAILRNASNVSSFSVGTYGKTTANVLDWNDSAVLVGVRMSYSYEYDCGDGGGAVDGQQTDVTYAVTKGSEMLEVVREGVLLPPC